MSAVGCGSCGARWLALDADRPCPACGRAALEPSVAPPSGEPERAVRFEVEPEPPVRVFTIFLDGAQTPAASSNTGPSLTIPVPCDGAVHQVLFIATGTGTDPLSSTQAVAFRAPRPA